MLADQNSQACVKAIRKRRSFTPKEKASIVQKIDRAESVIAGCREYSIYPATYRKWKKQLENGIHYALRSGRPPVDRERKELLDYISMLEKTVIFQSTQILDLKKNAR
jgi:transposase-like protein